MKDLSPDKQYVLIKGHDNYADEFEVEFFSIMEKEQWESIDREAKRLFKKMQAEKDETSEEVEFEWQRGLEVEVYFGTNEALLFNGYKDWRSKIKVEKISYDDAKVIISRIGNTFGVNFADVNFIEQLTEIAGEELKDD